MVSCLISIFVNLNIKKGKYGLIISLNEKSHKGLVKTWMLNLHKMKIA